jgi:pSer/pThr/pTyr-binding forkhead associated (FHA) protein
MAMVVQMHEGVAINKFQLDKPVLRIGRDPDSDIFIDNTVVSTEHAIIKTEEDTATQGGTEFYIEDLKSTNSTFVNGEKITRHKLRHNDLIRVGWIDEAEGEPNKTAKIRKSWIPGVYYTEDES